MFALRKQRSSLKDKGGGRSRGFGGANGDKGLGGTKARRDLARSGADEGLSWSTAAPATGGTRTGRGGGNGDDVAFLVDDIRLEKERFIA